MTPYLLAALAIWVVQTLLPNAFRVVQVDDVQAFAADHLRGKDHSPELLGYGARAERALGNYAEALPVFVTLALLLELQGLANETLATMGALVFVIARAVYVPAYMAAIFGVRTLVWTGGWVGLVMMITALLT